MGVDITQYRIRIGSFHGRSCFSLLVRAVFKHNYFLSDFGLRNILYIMITALLLCIIGNDIELNPGPDQDSANSNVLKICHLNIQSLKCNLEKMKHIYLQLGGSYNIITVSETWLASTNPDDKLSIKGYHPVYRKDRANNAPGGGVAVWVSSNLVAKRRLDLELPDTEALWLEVRSNNNRFLLCTVYRPPNSRSIFWDSLQYMTDMGKASNIHHIMIIGDINADDRTREGVRLQQFINANNLISHLNEPTRITPRTQSCLDRILSNMGNYVRSTQVLSPLLYNDHCTICITLNFKTSKATCFRRLMWDYSRGDILGLLDYLSNIQWHDVCRGFNDISFSSEIWTKTILDAAKAFYC